MNPTIAPARSVFTTPWSELTDIEKAQAVEAARQILVQDYQDDVRIVAQAVYEAAENGEFSDEQGMLDYMDETVDGFTIDTKICLFASAFTFVTDKFFEPPLSSDDAAASYAFRLDVVNATEGHVWPWERDEEEPDDEDGADAVCPTCGDPDCNRPWGHYI